MRITVRNGVCRLIERYQAGGGGRHYFGIDCNFTPTCSEYAKQAVRHYGLCKAVPLVVRRLSRCTHRDLVQKIDDPLSVPAVVSGDVADGQCDV